MDRFVRKRKIKGGAAAMEGPRHHQPSLGVRTRARTKTLALQRLQKKKSRAKSAPLPSSSSSSLSKSSSCYLQLRSRRLERCVTPKPRKAKPRRKPSPTPTPSLSAVSSPKGGKKSGGFNEVEVSCGDNVLEIEGNGGRISRETTPCSLIKRDSETISPPGSSTKPTNTARRIPSSVPRLVPYSPEMDELFDVPQKLQQKEFAEKYNFDPEEERPLTGGRYEWVKLKN